MVKSRPDLPGAGIHPGSTSDMPCAIQSGACARGGKGESQEKDHNFRMEVSDALLIKRGTQEGYGGSCSFPLTPSCGI